MDRGIELLYFEEFRLYELSDAGVVPQRTERYFPALVCCLIFEDPAKLKKIDEILRQQNADCWTFQVQEQVHEQVQEVDTLSVAIIARSVEAAPTISPAAWLQIVELEKALLAVPLEKTVLPNLGMEFVRNDVEPIPLFMNGVPILNQDFFRRARRSK